jgi:hypothetical protein
MKKITFLGHYGDEAKVIEVSASSDVAEGGFQLLIAHYSQGMLIKQEGRWVGYLNKNSDLQATDIDILGDIIESSPELQ